MIYIFLYRNEDNKRREELIRAQSVEEAGLRFLRQLNLYTYPDSLSIYRADKMNLTRSFYLQLEKALITRNKEKETECSLENFKQEQERLFKRQE